MFYWAMLLLAIATEVFSTSVMKLVGDKQSVQAYMFLFIMISLSYFFLSKAILRIPLGIAYAIWEGLGIVAITAIGYFLFEETVGSKKLVGIMSIICGIYLMQKCSAAPSERGK